MPTLALTVEASIRDDVGIRVHPGIPPHVFEERPALKTMIQGATFELRRPDGSNVRTRLVTYGIEVQVGEDGRLYVSGPPDEQPILLTFPADLRDADVLPGTEVWYVE